jgi:integrase
MEIEDSLSPKRCKSGKTLSEQTKDYLDSLYDCKELSKQNYAMCLASFVHFLENRGIKSFFEVTKADIGQYISTKNSQNTKNLNIFVIRNFFSNYLEKEEIVKHLHQKVIIKEIPPSELLTQDEIIALANEAGKRREMNKVIILVLAESCARINEVLNLRIGDIVFNTVTDKAGKRNLIAELHFQKSKGDIKKPSVAILMYSAEIKKWLENHPDKNNAQAYLFQSPRFKNEPINAESVRTIIQNAAYEIGLKKKINPHFFRHTMLSFFANELNYNDIRLKIRAGWTTSTMARRYIHSDSEIEKKSYLEAMGYVTVEEKPKEKIAPKSCPHCQALNPYTNTNCDSCSMPLDSEKYQLEIEKRRSSDVLFQNLNRLYTGKLSESQVAQIKGHTETIKKLTELGHEKLAEEYIQTLLSGWARMLLAP